MLLLVVAALLCAAAALAIGILLFGDFGSTEGRILATTALLAGCGLLALPAAILRDQRRLSGLAAAGGVLAIVAAALAIAVIWQEEPPEALGKAAWTTTAWLVAVAQAAALAGRHRRPAPRMVRRLFFVSSALVVVLAAMFTVLVWADFENEGFARIFGALVVLDVLLVALQPLAARIQPVEAVHRLRIETVAGETIELEVEAADPAAAAAKGIGALEREGRRVFLLELVDRAVERSEPVGEPPHPESPVRLS